MLALFLPFNGRLSNLLALIPQDGWEGNTGRGCVSLPSLLAFSEFDKGIELDFYPSSSKHLEGFPSVVYK